MRSKILSAMALTPFLLGAEMKKGEEPVCSSPFHAMHVGVRHTEANGVGYKDGYTTLEAFGMCDRMPSFMPFLDLRGHVFNDGKLAGNVGIGERSVIPSIDHVFGAYLYYDTRQSDHGLKVNQLSPGIELLGSRMEYRINGYFPIAKHKGHRYDFGFNSFRGHQIIVQSKRKYAMSGGDGEVGAHLTQSTRNDFYLGAGPYYFTSDAKTAWGGKGRIYWRYKEYVSLEGSYSYDHIFKNIVQGTATLSYPFGPKLKRKGKGCPNPEDLALGRAAFAPYRFEIPVITSKKKRSAAIDPATGQPWKVWFVNNTSSSSGTFESPFPTLVQAQNASAPNDIIYVYPGDGTSNGMNQGIVLQDAQKLFGSGVDQTIATTSGPIVLPAQSSSLPLLTNTGGSGTIIQLANGNEFAGLNIQGVNNSLASAVLGDEINGGSIHNNTIFGGPGGIAVNITGFGTFLIQDNTIFDTSKTTFEGIQLIVDRANSMSGIIANNAIQGFEFPLLILVNDSATGIFEIENNHISDQRIFLGSGMHFTSINSNGNSLMATVQNNQLSNLTGSALSVGGSIIGSGFPQNTCMEYKNNAIDGTTIDSVFISDSTPNTALNLTLLNNQILNTEAGFSGVNATNSPGVTVCLEMVGNNAPAGYSLDNSGGGTFSLGPIVDNIGPITQTGTFNEVGSCLCP